MIRDYTNEKDFEKLLDTLIELYCTEESLLPLFIGNFYIRKIIICL